MTTVVIIALVALVIVFIAVKPYFMRFDTVVAFTGGLGTGKSYISTLTAVRLLKKARFKTSLYNFFHPFQKLEKPLLYSSIPIRISRKEMSVRLDPDTLLLQYRIVKGSVVLLDEVDVFANQFAMGNENIIDTSSKKQISAKLENVSRETYDSGLFDEEVRLFRHLHSSPAVEARLVVNSQATSNITTIIRRRMNTVFVLSKFRLWKMPFTFGKISLFYTVRCREITITDEISNTDGTDKNDTTRVMFGFVPLRRLYSTHCYSHRLDGVAYQPVERWRKLTTNRLTKCPIDRKHNQSNNDI